MGNMFKTCDEYIGLVNTGDKKVSITQMHSPSGWIGPARYSEFHEYIVVLSGQLRIEHGDGVRDLEAGQSAHIVPNEAVILSTPSKNGCEYLSVCCPAYSRADVHNVK